MITSTCTSCPTCGLWGLILPISVHFPSLIRYPAVTSPKSPTISRQISVYMYSYVTMKKLPLYYTCLTYRVCGRVFGRRRGASRCPRAVHRQSPCTLPHTKINPVRILKLISNYHKISVRRGFWLHLPTDFGGILPPVPSRYTPAERGILNLKKT